MPGKQITDICKNPNSSDNKITEIYRAEPAIGKTLVFNYLFIYSCTQPLTCNM